MNSPEAPMPSRAPAPEKRLANGVYAGAPVVLAITVLNVAMFVLELVVERSLDALLTPKPSTMLALGANYAASTLREMRLETLLVSCFLHWGVIHIGFNMVALRQVGPFVERTVGSGRFAILYAVTGVAGSAMSAAWAAAKVALAPHVPSLTEQWLGGLERVSAGASGAICGVIGAVLVLGVRAQGWQSPLTRDMARWLGTVVLFGLFIGADNAAHLGGAAAGAGIAALWKRRPEEETRRVTRLVIAAALLALAMARVVWVDVTDPYAKLLTHDRWVLAKGLAAQGRCREAKDALAATLRLAPMAEGDLTNPLPECP